MLPILALSTFGWVVAACVFLCIWIALAFWPARVADRKGHSFFWYFVFSLICFPLALLFAYMVRDNSAPLAPA